MKINKSGANQLFVLILLILCVFGLKVSAQTTVQTPTPDDGTKKMMEKISSDLDFFGKTDDKAAADKSKKAGDAEWTDFIAQARTPERKALEARLLVIEKDIRDGKLNTSLDSLNEIIKANPGVANAYVQRASVYSGQGKFDLERGDVDKALSLDPRNAKAYAILGVWYAQTGDQDNCIKFSTKAIELDPKLELPYYNRGTVYVLKHDPQDAISDLTKAIEINPQYSDAYLNRGVAKGVLGDWDGKIDDLVMALEVSSSGNQQKAQEVLDQTIKERSDADIVNAIKVRYEGLGEKYNAATAQNDKLIALVHSKSNNVAICESLKETLSAFGAEKTAWRRAALLKHIGNLPSLQGALKYVNDVGASIVEMESNYSKFAAAQKCQ